MTPFTLLIKPSGSDCNLDCTYCFYKDRAGQLGRGRQRMSEHVLEALARQYMELGFEVPGFAWQGGEPTLMGIDFFAGAVDLQKTLGTTGRQVSNTMQTNAVLLDDEWCRFLHENKFLLGISIDGPRALHDANRIDHGRAGTFDRVMRGIEMCKAWAVAFSALVVLNRANVEHANELFEFLIDNDLTYVQFIPCIEVDPSTGEPADVSVTPDQYGDFLCRMFDLWHEYGPDKMNIRDFDSLLTHYVLGDHTMCTYSKQCTGFVVVEHTGDVFCCEFFVEPSSKLGNILETPLAELAGGSHRRSFARDKQRLCGKCMLCRHLDICRGGCVKDRRRLGGDSAVPSYFCEAYKQFFDHATSRFKQIAAAIQQGAMRRHTRRVEDIRLRIR